MEERAEMGTDNKLWALAMASIGTYAPGLEKNFMPKKHNVTIKRLKRIKLDLTETSQKDGETK